MDFKDRILKFLSESERNLNLTELQMRLDNIGFGLKRRFLQRAILELIRTGQVSRHGSGPATIYSLTGKEEPRGARTAIWR